MWKTILSNSAVLLVGRIVAKLATLGVMVLIARILGIESFGVFSALVAISVIAGIIADFGIVTPTIRSISQKEEIDISLVEETISARVFWGGIALVLMAIIGSSLGFPLLILMSFVASSICEVTSTFLIRSFEGRKDLRTVTFYIVCERILFAVFVLLSLNSFQSLNAVAVAWMLSALTTLALAYLIFRRQFGSLSIRLSLSEMKRYTRRGLPFFLVAAASALYYRADTVLLSILRTDAEVGTYNAALRVIDAQIFVPMTLMAALFPTMAGLHRRPKELWIVFARSFWIFCGLGLAVTLVLYFCANLIVEILFSTTYEESKPILQILSLTQLSYFLYYIFSHALIAIDKERMFTIALVTTAAINVIGNILVLPQYGQYGAAWMRVGCEALLCCSLGVVIVLQFREMKTAAFSV